MPNSGNAFQKNRTKAEMFEDLKNIKRLIQYQGLSYIPEIITIELINHFAIENFRICCQEILAVTNTCLLLK